MTRVVRCIISKDTAPWLRWQAGRRTTGLLPEMSSARCRRGAREGGRRNPATGQTTRPGRRRASRDGAIRTAHGLALPGKAKGRRDRRRDGSMRRPGLPALRTRRSPGTCSASLAARNQNRRRARRGTRATPRRALLLTVFWRMQNAVRELGKRRLQPIDGLH